MLSDVEYLALGEFLARPGVIREVLKKYAETRQREMEIQASESLRTIPRQIEQACDAAAKADVYRQLFHDLERFANQR